jgi:hydroxymethylpyrimidine kinase/phosphomethylpyrimidine kinase/thiamine-phosphate diphosphorylase
MNKVILSIAATDPCNGAGITADLQTIRNFGCQGMGAVTAVTAQNTKYVYSVNAVKKKVFSDQLNSLLSDSFNIDAVKIGLIPNKKILKEIVAFIKCLRGINENLKVVLDPVLGSTSGDTLIDYDTKYLTNKLFPLVDVITPNIHEAQRLFNTQIDFLSMEGYKCSMQSIALKCFNCGIKAILIKGGHLEDYILGNGLSRSIVIDTLILQNELSSPYYFLSLKKKFKKGASDVHGTGCILASGLASMLAKGHTVLDSYAFVKAYINQGIEESYLLGEEQRHFMHRPYESDIRFFPCMARTFEEIEAFSFNKDDDGFDKCPDNLGLYPVVDSSNWILKLCKAGVKTMQLRIKTYKDEKFLRSEIKKAVEYGNKYNARVFIDDFWELALEYKAYGVHLGQSDLDSADLKLLKLHGIRLGVSTHGYGEIARALLIKPSYVALGHIFPTNSKIMPSAPQGVLRLKYYVKLLQGTYPTVAIGGIKLDNLNSVMESEVGSIAVITAITQAENVDDAIKTWLEAVEGKQEEANDNINSETKDQTNSLDENNNEQ